MWPSPSARLATKSTASPARWDTIRAVRLDFAPPGTTPFPPHTSPDSLTVKKSALFEGELTVDVLANDFDGNCQTVSIGSVDANSARGATLGFVGSEITYTPPSDLFVGSDTFQYNAQDGSGLSTPGDVSVEVEPLNRIARWGFDEAAGNTIAEDGGLDGFFVARWRKP